jgi:broad specificity phosphatase PhoE
MSQAPAPSATYLYLIRHGATDANERRPYILQGRGVNYGLSTNGRAQAAAVAEFLKTFTLHRIYGSGLLRSIETAQAIAAHHHLEVQSIDELAECHVGQWEGLDWDTIMARHPKEWEAFQTNPAECGYLGGESYADVLRRVRPIFERLLEQHVGEAIAVVAHNIVNRVYLADLMGLDLCKAKDLKQANACVNVVRYEAGRATLMTLNACFHLPESLRHW